MTLLVASIREQNAIFLTDFQVTSKIGEQKTCTDELNKFFKWTFDSNEVYFLTAGSLQVWLEIKKLGNFSELFLNKTPSDIEEAFRKFITLDSFKKHQGKLGGDFIIHHDINKNNFMFYQLEFESGYGASITLLKDGTFFLGSGKKYLIGFEDCLHQNTWSRDQDSLFQKKCNIENQISSKLKPLDSQENYFKETGVSEVFNSICIEDGLLRFVNEEITEGVASVITQPKEHNLEITPLKNGSTTVQSSISGTSLIKSFGENLDRDGKTIKRL